MTYRYSWNRWPSSASVWLLKRETSDFFVPLLYDIPIVQEGCFVSLGGAVKPSGFIIHGSEMFEKSWPECQTWWLLEHVWNVLWKEAHELYM